MYFINATLTSIWIRLIINQNDNIFYHMLLIWPLTSVCLWHASREMENEFSLLHFSVPLFSSVFFFVHIIAFRSWYGALSYFQWNSWFLFQLHCPISFNFCYFENCLFNCLLLSWLKMNLYLDCSYRYGCRSKLLRNLAELGFKEPTPIQRQAIPVLLSVWSSI